MAPRTRKRILTPGKLRTKSQVTRDTVGETGDTGQDTHKRAKPQRAGTKSGDTGQTKAKPQVTAKKSAQYQDDKAEPKQYGGVDKAEANAPKGVEGSELISLATPESVLKSIVSSASAKDSDRISAARVLEAMRKSQQAQSAEIGTMTLADIDAEIAALRDTLRNMGLTP